MPTQARARARYIPAGPPSRSSWSRCRPSPGPGPSVSESPNRPTARRDGCGCQPGGGREGVPGRLAAAGGRRRPRRRPRVVVAALGPPGGGPHGETHLGGRHGRQAGSAAGRGQRAGPAGPDVRAACPGDRTLPAHAGDRPGACGPAAPPPSAPRPPPSTDTLAWCSGSGTRPGGGDRGDWRAGAAVRSRRGLWGRFRHCRCGHLSRAPLQMRSVFQ